MVVWCTRSKISWTRTTSTRSTRRTKRKRLCKPSSSPTGARRPRRCSPRCWRAPGSGTTRRSRGAATACRSGRKVGSRSERARNRATSPGASAPGAFPSAFLRQGVSESEESCPAAASVKAAPVPVVAPAPSPAVSVAPLLARAPAPSPPRACVVRWPAARPRIADTCVRHAGVKRCPRVTTAVEFATGSAKAASAALECQHPAEGGHSSIAGIPRPKLALLLGDYRTRTISVYSFRGYGGLRWICRVLVDNII